METQHQHLESLYPETTRFSEIDSLLTYVKKGDSCQMIAMPGVGRGNILKFLAYNRNIRIKHLGEKQTDYHFVFINFDEIKHRPLFDALKFIFLELVSSLKERNLQESFSVTDTIFKTSLSYHDELVLFQGLKDAIDYLTAEKNLHITLLFERFETYLPQLTGDFFTHLRSLRNRAKYKLSVIFSVTRPLEDTVEEAILADFFEFFSGHEVYLSLMDTTGMQFRIDYLERLVNKSLGKDYIDKIIQITAGHGKLTRLTVELILGKNRKNPEECISLAYLLAQKTIQSGVKEIWEYLTPAEQESIITITKHKEKVQNAFLEKIHLIHQGTITIPLFAEYVTENYQQITIMQQPITFDQSTNTIRKGEIVLSDRLTSSEFRLLYYFLLNPKKVLDREALIHEVWKDSASTLGVTDQALDQLIFRLRKKIEDNPNNPTHIQTVKGRGVTFTP